jgi:NDP-sugar pyrophosphorylase family protein
MFGQSLLEYWLSHLAATRVEEVCVLAADRVDQVRALVGDGARWGIKACVVGESRELTIPQALLKYETASSSAAAPHIAVLDHFPLNSGSPLFSSYSDWFAALIAWMPRALTADRLGHRLVKPGVWLGTNTNLSPTARLIPPCWVGQNAFIGARAVIGPQAIVENAAFIERDTEITNSYVGPQTFVGRFTEIKESLAWGNTLVQLKSGSLVKVPDPFVLCSLHVPWRLTGATQWLGRLVGLDSQRKESVAVSLKGYVIGGPS